MSATCAADAATTESLVRTIAGSGIPGNVDGSANSASFLAPAGIAVAPDGTIAVSDAGGERIRIIRNGVVETLAGGGDIEATGDSVAGSYADGPAIAARFNEPRGLAYLPDGTMLVADGLNHCLRAIRGATVTTFAGNALTSGAADGTRTSATFTHPKGLAVDARGHVFVADDGAGLREIADGIVSTIRMPASTGARALSVAVTGEGAARRIFVSTFAGLVVIDGDPSGAGTLYDGRAEGGQRIGHPAGLIAIDRNAVVFADAQDQTVRLFRLPARVDGNPLVEPLTENAIEDGANNGGGFRDGDLRDALFASPGAIARGADGNLLLADTGNRRIRSIATDALRLPRDTGGQALPSERTWIIGGSASYYDTLWGSSIPGTVAAAAEDNRIEALQYDDANPADVGRAFAQILATHPKNVVWILTTSEFASIGATKLSAILRTPSLRPLVTVCVLPLAGEIASAQTFAMLAIDPGADFERARTQYQALQQLVRASKISSIDVATQLQKNETGRGDGDPYATLSPYLTDEGRATVGKAIATYLAQRNAHQPEPRPNR